MTPYLLLALLLVAGMGFVTHRASLCAVRAVMEMMTSGSAYMLASFGKAVLWVVTISGSLIVLLSIDPQPVYQRLPFWAALLGGALFGVGAAINGGCSFSTLQRLADGELGMLVSLAGMFLGFAVTSHGLNELATSIALQPIETEWPWQHSWGKALLGALWLWAIWELLRLWRAHPSEKALLDRLLADRYRLSSAAAVLGIGGGILYAVQGAWTYTNFLRGEAASWVSTAPPPSAQAPLLLALIFGMLFSSWQRGTIRPRLPNLRDLPYNLTGGLLMGMGGTLVPGGNDTLLLAAMPSFSGRACAIFIALLAGVAVTLTVMRWQTGSMAAVFCSEDRCH